MKVLLVGATGNVGKYLIPALLARNHEVVAYIRNPTKLSPEATFKLGPESIVTGSALDSTAIKDAILSKDCDAVVNAAGLAPMTGFSAAGDFPEIFKTVVNAVVEAGEERVKQGKPVLRCWLMSGFGVLDSPKKPHLLVDFIPIFPSHKSNYNLIASHSPTTTVAWSLFCANTMTPKNPTPKFPPSADTSANNLIFKANSAPAWTGKLLWIPLIGGYLNAMSQAGNYSAVLEDCVDFIARDLEKGLGSELVGKRVGVKEKGKGK